MPLSSGESAAVAAESAESNEGALLRLREGVVGGGSEGLCEGFLVGATDLALLLSPVVTMRDVVSRCAKERVI